MRRLDALVARAAAVAMALVLLLLLLLGVLFGVLEQLLGGDALPAALADTLAVLPRRLAEMLPFVSLLGGVLALGVLAGSRELLALRAAGVSVQRIALCASLPGLALAVATFPITEYWLPQAAAGAAATGGPHWYREDDRFYAIGGLGAAELQSFHELHFDATGGLRTLRSALSATATADGWMLHGVRSTSRDGDAVSVAASAAAAASLRAAPDVLRERLVQEPDELTMHALRAHVAAGGGIATAAFELALWQRGGVPLSTWLLALLGAASVLGPLRAAAPGVRIVAAVATGIAFSYLGNLLSPLAAIGMLPPAVAALLPPLLIALAAGALLRRAA